MFLKIVKGKIWIFICTSIMLVSLLFLPLLSINNKNITGNQTPIPQNTYLEEEDLLLTGVFPTYYEGEGVNLVIGFSGDIDTSYWWQVESDNAIIIEQQNISDIEIEHIDAGKYNDSNDNEIMLNIGDGIILTEGFEYLFTISNDLIKQSMSFTYSENHVEFYSKIGQIDISPTSLSMVLNFEQAPEKYSFNKAELMQVKINDEPYSEEFVIPKNISLGKMEFSIDGLTPQTEYTINASFTNKDGMPVGRELSLDLETDSRNLSFSASFTNIDVGYESYSAIFKWDGNKQSDSNLKVDNVSAALKNNNEDEEILSLIFDVEGESSGEINFTIKNSEIDNKIGKEIILESNGNPNVKFLRPPNPTVVFQYGMEYYWDFKIDFINDEDDNVNEDYIDDNYLFSFDLKQYNYQSNIVHIVPSNNVGDDLEEMSSTYHWSGYCNNINTLLIEEITLQLSDVTDPNNPIDKEALVIDPSLNSSSGEITLPWKSDLIEEGNTYKVSEEISFVEDPAADYQIRNTETIFNDDNEQYIGKNKPILVNQTTNISGGSYNMNLIFTNTSSIQGLPDNISIEILFKDKNGKNNELIKDRMILSDGTVISDGRLVLDNKYIRENTYSSEFKPPAGKDDPGTTYYIPLSFTGIPHDKNIIIETNIIENKKVIISNSNYTELNFNYDKSYSINPDSLKLKSRYETNGSTYYEITMDIQNINDINVDFGEDIFIAENNNGKLEYKDGINVLNEDEYKTFAVPFGDYTEDVLYLKVDDDKLNTSKNKEIDFLLNLYIGINIDPDSDKINEGIIPEEILLNSSLFFISYIYKFPLWALITPFILLFILIVILLLIWLWYSSKKRRYYILYPLALRANENWLSQVISYNWNPKIEDYLMLSIMSQKDLNNYAKENNIPVPKGLKNEEKIDFISLLNESELEKVKEFIEYDFFIKEENMIFSREDFMKSSGTKKWTKRIIERIILQEQIDNNNITFDNIGFIVRTEYWIKSNMIRKNIYYKNKRKLSNSEKFDIEKGGDSVE